MAFKRTNSEVIWTNIHPYQHIWISAIFAKFDENFEKIWIFSKKWKFEKISNWAISMNFCPKRFGIGAFESPWPIFFDFAMYEHVRACWENLWICTYTLAKVHFYCFFEYIVVYSGLERFICGLYAVYTRFMDKPHWFLSKTNQGLSNAPIPK